MSNEAVEEATKLDGLSDLFDWSMMEMSASHLLRGVRGAIGEVTSWCGCSSV